MNQYRSIVILGGKGMLACALIEALRARGHDPVAVDRDKVDVTSPEELNGFFERHRPSLVVNCSAYTAVDLAEDEPEKAQAINSDALTTIACACGSHHAKLVHYSTDFVFDGTSKRPYQPQDITNPLSVYGKSKRDGETNVRLINPESWLIVRTSWLFGEHGNCFPRTIVKMAKMGKPLRVVQDQLGCPTYTQDLAAATLKLVDANVSGIQHVTNSGVTNWYDFASAILRETNLTADIAPVTTAQWLEMRPKQAIRPAYSALDCTSYTRATGATLRLWQPALQDYVQAVTKLSETA